MDLRYLTSLSNKEKDETYEFFAERDRQAEIAKVAAEMEAAEQAQLAAERLFGAPARNRYS